MAERLLDVNVPMYAAGKEHPYKVPCAWVMTEIAEGRIEAAIDVEIIQELLYRYGAIKQWRLGVTMAENLLDIVTQIYPIEPADVRLTIKLFERYTPKGITARDAVHVAVMQNNGLTEIISTDAHFDLIKGIQRLDPQMLFGHQEKRD